MELVSALTRALQGEGVVFHPQFFADSGKTAVCTYTHRSSPDLAYLFPHQFCILWAKISPRWPNGRSQGQVKRPLPPKKVQLAPKLELLNDRYETFRNYVERVTSIYKTYISEFLYLWPDVRSISRPPHYKSMGEIQISTSSKCHQMPSTCSGSRYYRSLLVIQPKHRYHLWPLEGPP